MYFDDFIARQILRTDHTSPSYQGGARPPAGRPLGTLWSGVRRLVRGIDAFTRARQGPAPRGSGRPVT